MADRSVPATPNNSPTPGDIYIAAAIADHLTRCASCRARATEADARATEYGESIRRRDRIQLGLRITPSPAVTR